MPAHRGSKRDQLSSCCTLIPKRETLCERGGERRAREAVFPGQRDQEEKVSAASPLVSKRLGGEKIEPFPRGTGKKSTEPGKREKKSGAPISSGTGRSRFRW